MCRRQPGPRCPQHSKIRLDAKIARRSRLHDRLTHTTAGTLAHSRLLDELRTIDDDIIMDANDYNSSPSRWRSMADYLETHTAAGDTDSAAFKQTARDLATGKMLWAERRRQNAMMPPIDRATASIAARAAWDDLGNARANMARYRVRMDMNGADYETWLRWQQRHRDAAVDATIAAARFEAITRNGPAGWSQLNPEQRLAARQAVAATADFTTPTAPQPLSEVINDYADHAEGKPPFVAPELAKQLAVCGDNPDPEIDSVSWAQQRAATRPAAPPGTAGGGPRTPAPTDSPSDGPGTQADNSSSGRDDGRGVPGQMSQARIRRQQTPPGYAGQRAQRSRRLISARQAWAGAKRGKRYLDGEALATFRRPDPEQAKNQQAAALLDVSGLSLLLEMMKPSR